MVLLRKMPLPKLFVISKNNWERALLDYCSGEVDLVTEAKQLQTLGYTELGVAARYISKPHCRIEFEVNCCAADLIFGRNCNYSKLFCGIQGARLNMSTA